MERRGQERSVNWQSGTEAKPQPEAAPVAVRMHGGLRPPTADIYAEWRPHSLEAQPLDPRAAAGLWPEGLHPHPGTFALACPLPLA